MLVDAVKSGSDTVLTHYRPSVEIERWDVLASETQHPVGSTSTQFSVVFEYRY